MGRHSFPFSSFSFFLKWDLRWMTRAKRIKCKKRGQYFWGKVARSSRGPGNCGESSTYFVTIAERNLCSNFPNFEAKTTRKKAERNSLFYLLDESLVVFSQNLTNRLAAEILMRLFAQFDTTMKAQGILTKNLNSLTQI